MNTNWSRDFTELGDYVNGGPSSFDDAGYWPGRDSTFGPVHVRPPRRHQTDLHAPPPFVGLRRRPPLPGGAASHEAPAPTRGPPPSASASFLHRDRSTELLASAAAVLYEVPSWIPFDWSQPPAATALAQRPLPLVEPLQQPATEVMPEPPPPVPIEVQVTCSAVLCELNWSPPHLRRPPEKPYVYRIDAQGATTATMELPQWKTNLRIKTTPGEWYKVDIRAVLDGNHIIGKAIVEFKAVFSSDEMLRQYERASEFVSDECHPFEVFYRCKPKGYWDDIKFNRGDVMEKYIKDNNGQAASPVNGEIYGLFFSARLLPNGQIPVQSPFGDIRMSVPARALLDPLVHRMYFSDFYCNYTVHYVTVVVCVRGSKTDEFCAERLIQLDPANNPFLRCVQYPGWFQYFVARKVWVEIYFTENVPLAWGRFEKIIATGAGTSTPGGLPHNKTCRLCNLYPMSPPGQDKKDKERDRDRDRERERERDRRERDRSRDRTERSSRRRRSSSNERRRYRRRRRHSRSRSRSQSKSAGRSRSREFNSTFHLAMDLERDRLAEEERKKATEVTDEEVLCYLGEVDVVDTVCYIVDLVIAEVGENVEIPEHGNVGRVYQCLNKKVELVDLTQEECEERESKDVAAEEIQFVAEVKSTLPESSEKKPSRPPSPPTIHPPIPTCPPAITGSPSAATAQLIKDSALFPSSDGRSWPSVERVRIEVGKKFEFSVRRNDLANPGCRLLFDQLHASNDDLDEKCRTLEQYLTRIKADIVRLESKCRPVQTTTL